MQRRRGRGRPGKQRRTSGPKARKTPTVGVSIASLQEQVAALTRELKEAREQQSATGDVLKVISRSTFDLQTVLDTLVELAVRLCEADTGIIRRRDGDIYPLAATFGFTVEQRGYFANYSTKPDRGSVFGRAIMEGRTIHVPDLLAGPDLDRRRLQDYRRVINIRSGLGVPLVREGTIVGVFTLQRTEPRAFTDKQIELAQNFASQAVIAIENTRLLNELRQRTGDLTEALDQQTATSEVLKVISSSAGELQPVFQAMLQNATRICEAHIGILFRYEDGAFTAVSLLGVTPAYAEYLNRGPIRPGPGTGLGRVASTRQTIHIVDTQAESAYAEAEPLRVATAKLGGARTLLNVPMLKDGELIGSIGIYRQEVRPFTDKQVELVSNFAAQAVIAIENARLLNELRQRTDDLTEALEQQTATSEVLRVISSSPTNVQPVFDAIAESAVRLCDGQFSFVVRFDGKVMDFASCCGLSAEGLDAFHSILPMAASEHTAAGRAIVRRAVVAISDVETDPSYGAQAQGLAKTVTYRSIAAVPLLNEGNPIGAIAVARANAGSFPKRQIVLLQAFADQAVIAIANVRLFDEVQARTRELAKSLDDLRTTQDRLVQTQKLASLGQLTAGIAHEIKNPLNFVNNFSGLSSELIDELQEALGDVSLIEKRHSEITELMNTLRGNLDKVIQHGKRADAIVKNMLQHSREGSGEHGPVDINALVEECLSLAWHGARAEKQGFAIIRKQSFDPSAGKVDIFPQDITRALLNLISNGFYAATKRNTETNGGDYEPTLTASTRNLGDRVEIRIRDNGTGISPDVKEKMFNPFFTTKPTGEGTGLGLSISHDIIVKQHAGSIDVDTQPGEFTEIIVTLPRAAVFV